MTTRKKWLTAGIVVAVLAILAVTLGPYIYIHFIKGEEAESLVVGCDDTSGTTTATTTGGSAFTITAGNAIDASRAEGTWAVAPGSVVGYRVKENLFGQSTTAVGRSSDVTGTVTVDGGKVTAASFEVQMNGFHSPESRRDAQFNGRIMSVDQFPTSKFVLSQPVALPARGGSAPAVGDLTLHGVTKPVTLTMTALDCGKYIDAVGSTKVVFADFSIPAPSTAGISVDDNGLLEVELKLVKS
jgi:polyisoprenoid-binding protein YceI